MNFTKRRWFALLASCLINLCVGSLYAWSVFAEPMAAHLNTLNGTALTAGSLSIVFTVANAVGPITMISGGFINDRLGPQRAILIGGVLFGCSVFFSSFADSVLFLVVTHGLGCGLGIGLVYSCTLGNSVKAFPDMRGLIGGIATATYGLSSVIVAPIANALIRAFGVIAAFRLLGVVSLVVVFGAAFFVFPCPTGFTPIGWTPPTTQAAAGREKNWHQMLADPSFYLMFLMLTCGAVAGLMITSQASSIAQHVVMLSATSASATVSALALFNTGGRVAAGYLSDRIGRIKTLLGSFLLSTAGLILLSVSSPTRVALFYMGIATVGFCFGALMGIFPGFTADQFGAKNNSVNYGIMFMGFAFAGTIGPIIMNRLYAATGTYIWAFLFAAMLNALGLILTQIWRRNT